MAYYVDNAGSNTAPYDTWAKAANALATIAAIDAAGDTIYIASTHTESTAGTISYAWAGTQAAPIRIICGTTAAAPPTTYATTAQVATSGTNAMTIGSSGVIIVSGVKFTSGSGASSASFFGINSTSGLIEFIDCELICGTTSATQEFRIAVAGVSILRNCTFTFGATGQHIRTDASPITIVNGAVSGSAITTFVSNASASGQLEITGFDFSACASTLNIINSTAAYYRMSVRDCKMPASWSGTLNASTPGLNSIYELFNCDSEDTHYRYIRQVGSGTVLSQTGTLIRTGGATDKDGTVLSWKATANANASAGLAFRTGEIQIWNTTTGSSVTATISILHDSATNLTNAEIWLELQYLGTSGVPLWSSVKDDVAGDNSGNYLATAADQASDSGSTWDTTGMSNPNKQKVSVTFTPQETGYIRAVVAMATANGKVVYIDPKIQLS